MPRAQSSRHRNPDRPPTPRGHDWVDLPASDLEDTAILRDRAAKLLALLADLHRRGRVTEREHQIILALAQGEGSLADAARALCISEATARGYLKRLRDS